jgi:hypothetical protein
MKQAPKKALAYRLFRVGKMPPALQAIAAAGGVLVAGEGASIRFDSRGLRMPGRYTSRGVRLHVGAVVLTGDRIALSLGRQPVLDNPYGTDTSGPLTVTADADGVHLHLDIAAAVPGGGGTLDISVRTPVDGTPLVGTRHVQLSSAEAATLTRFG